MTMRVLFAATIAVGALAGTSAFAGSPYYDQSGTMDQPSHMAATPTSGEYSAIAGDEGATGATARRKPAAPAATAAAPTGPTVAPVPEMFSKAAGYNGSP